MNEKAGRRPRWIRKVAAAFALVVIVLRVFFFELHIVSGASMWPGFCPDGRSEWVIVRRTESRPGRNRLVIVEDPDGATVLKRQVAEPGESPRITDGDVLVGGTFLRRTVATLWAQRVPLLSLHDLAWSKGDVNRRILGPHHEEAVVPLKGRVSLSDEGGFLLIEADEEGRGAVRIPRTSFRDAHRSAHGRIVPGENVVRDIIVTVAAHRWPRGRTLSVEQWLQEAGAFPAAELALHAREGGLVAELIGGRNPATGQSYAPIVKAGPWPLDSETVVRWSLVDGVSVVHVRKPGDDRFHEVSRQPRSTAPAPFESYLKLGTRGGSVVLSRLDIDRDIHYTPRPRGTGSGVGGPRNDLPAESVFVLGDNSPESRDSRHWPPLADVTVRGHPVLVIWPWDRLRWLGD